MQNFLHKHKKLLSVSLSVVASVFLVAIVVSAATVIGANIVTGGSVTVGSNVLSDTHNADTLGTSAVAWANVYTSGTIYAGSVSSTGMSGWKNNASDLGSPKVAWKDVYVSGTIYAGAITSHANLTLGGGATVTSTFNSGVSIAEAASTSTLQLGDAGVAGEGGCIVMSAGDGASVLYIFPVLNGTTIHLATSTNASDCY
ncbi:hypothetical protein L6259_03465 [Candidatus Parcubacteria bacterium]|nr:hypothetical protein [Patescibacteria group bacterium]MCG2694294.1 hypothetical protein [Candidatus Parcubacteria bacterium]